MRAACVMLGLCSFACTRTDPAQHIDTRWSGSYYEGDGLGANLSVVLSQDATFSVTASGCVGTSGEARGVVHQKGDEVELALDPTTDEQRRANLKAFETRYRLVGWGERRYLVAVEQLADFAGEVNLGREPRTSRFGSQLLAAGDERLAAPGSPALPPEAGLVKLIEGRVSEVRERSGRWRLTADIGEREGIAEGTMLYLEVASPFVPRGAAVEEVREHTSCLTIARGASPPEVGSRIATRVLRRESPSAD